MCRTRDLHIFSSVLYVVALGILPLLVGGCATWAVPTAQPTVPLHAEKEIEKARFPVPPGDDVIGRLAVMRLENGDTLPDIARHFNLGSNAISAANPGVDVWVPAAGERIVLPLTFILPDAPRKGIVINLAAMRLFRYKGEGTSLVVSTYPVGIGTTERPTPTGEMHVVGKATRPTWHVPASIAEDHRKKGDPLPAEVPPGPLNPLGERALYLSKAGYLIHGTNKPASIGLKATNGCMRLYPENATVLYDDTPVNTPVVIVNQPYLIGKRDGVFYLEAHTPLEGSDAAELEKTYAKLKGIEKISARPIDWKKVTEVQAEARGIPVPIHEMSGESAKEAEEAVEIEHPARIYGTPEIPELTMEAWYVLAAVMPNEVDALRIAAIINHQGPQIPARVISTDGRYRVLAGPFVDIGAAKEAKRRLKIDLEMDGILIEPAPPLPGKVRSVATPSPPPLEEGEAGAAPLRGAGTLK